MSTTPELSALQDLCARFDGAGIAYMLTGSLAMSHYARPRMTRDIDLVVALEASAAHTLTEALGEDYYADGQAIEEGFRLLRPCNVIHLPSVVKIDLIPRKESEYRRLEFERRRKVYFAGVELWIASREDLILSKLEWARESKVEHDTTPAIDALLRERFAALTGSQRALMALQMFETAQRIVLSSLPPGISEHERRRELCRRFYGEDLARLAYPRVALESQGSATDREVIE